MGFGEYFRRGLPGHPFPPVTNLQPGATGRDIRQIPVINYLHELVGKKSKSRVLVMNVFLLKFLVKCC